MGIAAIYIMWGISFRSPYPLRIHMKFGFDWPSGFWSEDVWRVFPIWVYVKQVIPGAEPPTIWTILVAVYKIKLQTIISKACAF